MSHCIDKVIFERKGVNDTLPAREGLKIDAVGGDILNA